MAFTAQLGTANSYLGNIELGIADTASPASLTSQPPAPGLVRSPIPGTPAFRLAPADCILHTQFVAPPSLGIPCSPPVIYGPPRPGSPWFRLQLATSSPIIATSPPTPDIVVTQKVVVQSRFTVNSAVLTTGRRPDRPGS